MNEETSTYSDRVFHQLLTFQHYVRRYSRHLIDERGLTPRDFSVLHYLLECGTATVGQVVGFVHKSPSTTSSLIAQLEERGYVTRTRSQDDNRVVHISLTPLGREISQNTPLGGLPLLRRRLSKLSKKRLVEMECMLDEIMLLMDAKESV